MNEENYNIYEPKFDKKVFIETEEGEIYKFKQKGETIIPEELISENMENFIENNTDYILGERKDFPITFDFYINDEASRYDKRKVAEELSRSIDDELVETIANIGYEIKLRIKVEDSDTAKVTHYDGIKLEQPKEIC